MSKIITDEQELNTATGELVTEDYALEILGLQSIADFRKFSRSFMKLSKIVKRIENSDNNKSEKGHLHDDRYYTEAEINEKFKNFCPYAVGDIYVTTNSSNPSTKYLGTTWSKIEGRFLLGTSGGGASKQTGGSMSKTIQQGNLPNIKLRVDSFSLTTQPHKHGIASSISVFSSNGGWRNLRLNDDGNISGSVQSLSAGGQNTGSASPQTSALGSGQALDITPSFYTTHMWLRTS